MELKQPQSDENYIQEETVESGTQKTIPSREGAKRQWPPETVAAHGSDETRPRVFEVANEGRNIQLDHLTGVDTKTVRVEMEHLFLLLRLLLVLLLLLYVLSQALRGFWYMQ